MSSATAIDIEPLLKRLARDFKDVEPAGPPDESADPVEQLVFSMLLWEAPEKKAREALRRLYDSVVDLNELRVSLPADVEEALGPRYPLVGERAERLLSVLDEVYHRERAVTLEPLHGMNKRAAKTYLDTLPGLPQYAGARVMLFSLGGHAVPVDSRLLEALKDEQVVDEDADVERAAGQLERAIRAADAPHACALLHAWVEAGAKRSGGGKRKTTRKKRSRKTTG